MRTEIFEEESIEPQMAPLIDCVFLLLIFFLVATTLKKLERQLPVSLPPAVQAQEVAMDPQTLVIGVDLEGRMYLSGNMATPGVLMRQLDEVATHQPDRPVRIDADCGTPFEHVVQALEALNVRSISNVSVHVADRK
ncbi:biopolymer transport protein ExbD [Neorhodopirellula lusitana]|uniref:Biopolymer transport protein ExbD n=1 Tax=Neorhodopirellula lusitana TaxID=445327 RepID=A0ABY1PUK3_9BACT|nr:biopolymer transporter ExbD [Neorhodopirellula lusitana]SMP48813.1 biopolymer transport protein ExbD [Neorhodopirellula lusitana]